MAIRKKRRSFYRPTLERVEDRRLLAADLALNVTDADATAEPGGTVAYQFEYSNVGDEVASASIRTYVPRNTTLAEEGSTEGWECEEARRGRTACTLEVGEVAPEETGVATLAVTVNEDLSRWTRNIYIQGRISGDELRDRNDSDWSVTPVIRQLSDLQLDLTVAESEVAAGESIVYTFDYSNQGVVAAPGATITMNLPDNTAMTAEGSTEGWVCEEGTCTLTLGQVAAEATGQATLVLAIDADTPTNVRSIRAFARITDDGSGVDDANPWNNRAWERVKVIHQVPDLSVELDDGDVESVEAGGTLIYTVNYANAGLAEAAGAVLTFQLPRGASFTAEGSSDGWACEEGVCTLDIGNLSADGTGSATIAVVLDAEINVRNLSARVSIADDGSAGDDANPRNNLAREWTRVAREESERPSGFGGFFGWLWDRFRNWPS